MHMGAFLSAQKKKDFWSVITWGAEKDFCFYSQRRWINEQLSRIPRFESLWRVQWAKEATTEQNLHMGKRTWDKPDRQKEGELPGITDGGDPRVKDTVSSGIPDIYADVGVKVPHG